MIRDGFQRMRPKAWAARVRNQGSLSWVGGRRRSPRPAFRRSPSRRPRRVARRACRVVSSNDPPESPPLPSGTFAVVEEVRQAGPVLVAVADNLTILPNKEDVTSEVLVFALGLAAKLERTAIHDRISAARERIEAEGGRWGRPSRVDTPTRARAAQLRAEGKTVREIARTLHVPRSTIARALARGAA